MPQWSVFGALSDETYGDILGGFTKCSNEDFKAVFQHLLTQKRIHSPIATLSYGSPSSEPTIIKIKHILCNANDLYNNLATANKWAVNLEVNACFNCGGDHGPNHCNEPCDQNHIAKNKAKFEEKRNHASSGGCKGEGHPCGYWHNQGRGNYERNKLGVTNTVCANCNGIQRFDGVWMAFCSKCQAWSGALNAHTTGFHDVALLAGSSYCLFSQHHSTTPSSNSFGNKFLLLLGPSFAVWKFAYSQQACSQQHQERRG